MIDTTKITDLLTSKNVSGYYRIYDQTQWYDRSELKLFQLLKLKKLINHCYNNVPFYRNFMKSNGITPSEISSLEHINLFPIITKEIIQADYDNFIPLNIRNIKGVKTGQTGGTTGNILFKRTDANTRSSTWAAYKRFEDWMGLHPWDLKLILMGGHVINSKKVDTVKKWVNNVLTRAISFNPYDTSENNLNEIINSLDKNSFKLIRSYSQFLFSFAKKLKEMGLTYNVNAITTTAEPLMPEHRKLFSEVFNAKVYDQYGFGEIGGVAFECNKHTGLHITEERVLVEVNSLNELIVTDLDNYAMPYIRYWNADQVILSENICSCGRKSRLIKEILGRTCDYILGVNGEFLHWAYFWHLFFDSQIAEKRDLKKFQVVQKSKNEINIRLVANKLKDEETSQIIDNIQSRLGKINITFSYEKDIENATSGKYRPVINKLI